MDPTVWLIVLASVAGLAGAFFVGRLLLRPRVDQTFYHFRCPGCKRRIRFQARQAGRKGQCSNCARDLTFPATSQSID